MTKTVRMVAEILAEKCTGCALCVYVCPTVAITLRNRLPDEPGTHRRIAEVARPTRPALTRPTGSSGSGRGVGSAHDERGQ